MPNTCSTRSSPRRSTSSSDKLDAATSGGASVEEGVLAVVKDAWTENKRIVFSGDNYSDEWHAEAEQRGLANLKQSPEALPWLIEPSTVDVFGRYKVLSERELHSRYEVAVEQYVTTINIEGETAASIARTMLLPAAIRWLGTLKEVGIAKLVEESAGLVDEFVERIFALETAKPRDHPEDGDILDEREVRPGRRSSPPWPPCARSPTSSSGSCRTTSGRSRSTPRSSSSSRRPGGPDHFGAP